MKLISSSSGSNGKRRIVKCLGRNVFESRDDDDDDDDVPTTSINTGHYTRLLQLSLIPRLFENGASQPANNSRPDTRRAAMLPSTFFFFFPFYLQPRIYERRLPLERYTCEFDHGASFRSEERSVVYTFLLAYLSSVFTRKIEILKKG